MVPRYQSEAVGFVTARKEVWTVTHQLLLNSAWNQGQNMYIILLCIPKEKKTRDHGETPECLPRQASNDYSTVPPLANRVPLCLVIQVYPLIMCLLALAHHVPRFVNCPDPALSQAP